VEDSGSADELDLAEMLLSGRLAPSTPVVAVNHKGGTFEPSAPVKSRRRQPSEGASVPQRAVPGTSQALGPIASAAEAAMEKHRASEGRNVEHVALGDDLTEDLKVKNRNKRRR